ncbi:biopolymer transport transmembrane protein [Herbaspirillum sp. GW103]|jgi:biopolymer transport protein ExbB|uniref:MotA/TolQ/ExbB proton channel family protein n=1 Tax=unclassified Herbaspirillum TaxID=2624150 RepID=UPI00025E3E2E|nr:MULTISPECIES: MotA/TolQ/ExbB proton channel family protein [unclassified Herbaspirillum]EIJ45533.1 biopolymer transport transmembrane protein [Herbaspirillum sp. GW103]MCI1005072.1 MotA/TolQ/ExbB proton channel family protein [Herbaspirillum sp. C7C8]NUT61454.1 MotA/TolQ/ExbB proton channel family protein [Herbaspirillum sp. C9C3]
MDASPYGLTALWSQGDVVTKAVAILLTMMSMASWYVILTKALQLLRYRAPAQAAGHAFWQADNVAAGVSCLGRDNPFVALASAGQGAVDHHTIHQGQLQDRLPVSEWVTLSLRQAIDEASASLQSGMAVLASVGSTAPFVGLFGTVWGIYHALVSIGSSGQASIDKVAGPVGEALIMTALGLAVAIPATFGYNALLRGNKSIIARLNKFGFELHALFVTGARADASGAGPQQSHTMHLRVQGAA